MFDGRCVNKVSRRFSLPLLLRLVFRIQLPDIFFSIACLWSFRKLQKPPRGSDLWKQYSLVQCNPLLKHRTIFHHSNCSHVLGNEKVHAYQVPSRKKTSPILQEIKSNFNELAIFPSRIKGIDSRKFSRIANPISEPKIGHVTIRRVCYRWWPD